MTEDQEKLLAVFEVRVRDLIQACKRQKQEISELRRSLESKDGELQQAMQTIETWKAKYDSLLAARIISADEKEMKSARKRLSKLVREVEVCIALLNE
jgi:urease accessory protein UreH